MIKDKLTPKDKELILKDISSRFPISIKIKVRTQWFDTEKEEIFYRYDDRTISSYEELKSIRVEDFRPYLFPISSMTLAQVDELFSTLSKDIGIDWSNNNCSFINCSEEEGVPIEDVLNAIEWFNKNHIDYRGLIKKKLAFDATGLNIY